MDVPTMFEPYNVEPDIDVLPSYFPVPGYDLLPINAFVLKASQPVLVDSGMMCLNKEFMEKLSSVIDPADLRWLWLTHADPDHVGSLWSILEAVPKLRLITTFIGLGRLNVYKPFPMDRVYLLNPGQTIDVGDRVLKAVKPPSFDSPETTGFYDAKSKAFFCADCFGALISEPQERAAGIASEKLKEGMTIWATIDAPWLHIVDKALFAKNSNIIRDMSAVHVLSAHLPAAYNMTDTLLDNLSAVPGAEPFIGPDQKALEEMLKLVTGR
ncbi:MAG: MBL fold metallo-hydrolase [Sedimentisphaerales bacterium]